MRVVKLSTADHTAGIVAKDGQVQTSVYAAAVPRATPAVIYDKDGRKRYERPTSYQIDAVLRALPGLHSSPSSHKTDLAAQLRRLKQELDLVIRGLVLCTDQGYDWDRYSVGLRMLGGSLCANSIWAFSFIAGMPLVSLISMLLSARWHSSMCSIPAIFRTVYLKILSPHLANLI